MDYVSGTVMTGIGATAVMDLWGILRQPLIGVKPPDYGLVGRWLAYMPRGQFRHASIAAAAPVPGERLIGWAAHYLTGVLFAALLVAHEGAAWFAQPSLASAMLVGLGSVAAPFLLMQPGMGAGIAASRTPRPNAARLQSVVTHAFFGIGLFLSGWAVHLACTRWY